MNPEIFIEPYGHNFKWFLVSEYSKVIAQGIAKSETVALRHGQQALIQYFEYVKG